MPLALIHLSHGGHLKAISEKRFTLPGGISCILQYPSSCQTLSYLLTAVNWLGACHGNQSKQILLSTLACSCSFVFFFVLSLTLFDPLCVDPLWLSMFDSQEKETHDGCHCFCKTCKVTSHVHLIRMGGSIQALKNENT